MKTRLDQAGGAAVLIGIGLIFLLNIGFWPWILFVVAIPAFLHRVSEDGVGGGLKAAVWLIGIGVIALFDLWWPGILILVGVSILVETLFKSSDDEELIGKRKTKPKRGLPIPEDEDWDEPELYTPSRRDDT